MSTSYDHDTGHNGYTTGAFKTSWSGDNPRDLMLKLRGKNPDAGAEEMFELLSEAMEKPVNQKYLPGILQHFCTNSFASLLREEAKSARRGKTTFAEMRVTAEIVEKDYAAKKATVKDRIEKRGLERAKIVLLSWVQPNGKMFGKCGRDDIMAENDWRRTVANQLGEHDNVEDVFTEQQLNKIRETEGC